MDSSITHGAIAANGDVEGGKICVNFAITRIRCRHGWSST